MRPQIHPDVRKQWGANLKKQRLACGFARQRDFADALEASQATVCRWETGQAAPSDADKVRIANLLHAPIENLFPLSRGTGVEVAA